MKDLWKIELLKEEDGITYINGNEIIYKTGYQVATSGVECLSAKDAITAAKKYNGNCGVWFSKGTYYVDESMRVKTKKQALRIGRVCHQISILKWDDMSLVYLKKEKEC